MILADKIIELRKKQGWSQEELAQQLGISRQSVSKWENGASIPDLDKIIKLSGLFGVSTDYLLKDSMEPEVELLDLPTANTDGKEAAEPIRMISLEEANIYLDVIHNTAGRISLGVALCILSPVLLIFLAALSDEEGGFLIPEGAAVGVGMTVLLVLVAVAVSIFIFFGRKLEPYGYLEREVLELAYGVTGVIQKQKSKYEDRHRMQLVIGVGLCILSVIPLMVLAALDEGEGGILPIVGVDICLILVAFAVFLLVRTCIIYGAYLKLLEEGEYTRERKIENEKNNNISTVYWCVVTAIYLAWSFYTMQWHRTWIIWLVAGVLFGVLSAVTAMLRKR